jgi:GNAT superfamily N-acetyltransferase
MTTDAPQGDLDEPAEEWTIERLDDWEREVEQGPRFAATTAAEHVPSGELVGFTQLMVARDTTRPVDQDDTIVLKEHRGHRLGMLLKVANIRQLEEVAPGHPSIITFNAEENRPMLDVNEAVGFVPVGYEAAWQKTI